MNCRDISTLLRRTRWWGRAAVFGAGFALTSAQINAQTTIISAAGDGGFTTGGTFAANGWTLVNGTPTSTQNQWIIGPSSTSGVGSGNTAYITNNTTTSAYAYSITSPQYIVHFYRDVTFLAGETNISLNFDWRGVGETTAFDGLQVSLAPTATVPVASATAPTGSVSGPIVPGATVVGNVLYFNQSTATNTTINIPASAAGNCSANNTLRLIFTFRMDGSVGTSPATAIDNISLVSSTPVITAAGGTYTINNTLPTSGSNFQTFTAAINAANAATACGPLTGPLTFNVSAGQTFNENVPALTGSGNSVSNFIRFQRSGVGANPRITAPGTVGTADFSFCVQGGDFITLDGIDLDASAVTAVEFGLLVRSASATNGAQNNTFQNMVITQGTRTGSNTSYGIFQTASSTGGGVVPTSAAGANSTNRYYNFTVTSVRDRGVYLLGNTGFPDLNCEVGTSACATRNIISNVGPTVTTFSSAGGIQVEGQSGVKIFNNNVSAVAGNQSSTRGIYMLTSAGNAEVYRNIVRDVSVFGSTTTTSSSFGIQAEQLTTGTNNLRIYNNAVSNLFTSRTSASATRYVFGIFVGVASATSSQSYDVDNNTVSIGQGLNSAISSACFEVQNNAAVYRIRGNIFANYSPANATARHYALRFTGATWGAAGSVCNFNDYWIPTDLGTSGFLSLVNATNNATIAAQIAAMTSPAAQDANSLAVDPGLSDPNTNLQASALALNNVASFAVPAWVTDDILCASRGASPHDFGAYAITPVTLDMGATALVAPPTTGCYNATQTVTVTIRNFGISTIDFSVNPTTVTVNVTGAVTTTLSATVNSGTLASGSSQNVNMSTTLNMTTAGTYTFNASTSVTGDGNAGNDAMVATNRTVVAPVALPQSVNFTGYTGANLTTVFPNWSEAAGPVTPSGTTSSWTNGALGGTTARINLFSNTKNEWIVGPKFTAVAGASLTYSIAITDFGAVTADPSGMQGTDDFVQVRLSTDCGLTWTPVTTWNAANTTALTNVFVPQTLSLTPYAGQECILAFFGSEGTLDDTPDYDFHIDDISIASGCTGAPSAGTSSGPVTACLNATAAYTNNATNSFSGITYTWYSSNVSNTGPWSLATGTGVNTQSYTTAALTPAGTRFIVMSAKCTLTGDSTLSNVITLVINGLPTVTIPTVSPLSSANCSGAGVTMTASGASTYTWLPNSSLAPNNTSATVTSTVATTTTYTVTGTDANGCTNTATQTVNVGPNPTMGAVTATPSTVCENGSSNLSASATTTGYVQGVGGSSFIDISATGAAVPTPAVGDDSEHNVTIPSFTFNGTAYTQLRIGNNGKVVLGVTTGDVGYANSALPYALSGLGATTAGSVAIMPWWDDLTPGTGNSIRTQTVGNLFIVQWTNEDHFDAPGTGTITFQLQLDLATGVIYFAYSDVDFTGTAAQDKGGTATVGLQFSATSFLQSSLNTQSLAAGQVISYTPAQPTYSWLPLTNSLTGANTATPTASVVTATETYTVTATSSIGCTSTGTVTVTMVPQPDAGTNGTLTICEGETVTAAQLFAQLGGTPDAGGAWAPTLAGAGVYTYTVSPTAPCAVPATATVTVTEQAAPDAGTNGTLTICEGETVTAGQLFAELGGTPDGGGSWTPVLAGAGVYTYTVNATAPCAVNATATVTVTEQAAPDAGTNGTLTICVNAASVNLLASLGGTPDGGGSWTFGGNPFSGTFVPGTDVAGVYTYTVNAIAPCVGSVSATVTVSYDNTDTDGDAVIDCLDNCPSFPGVQGGSCDANPGPGFSLGVINGSCACVAVPCTNNVVLDLRPDAANSSEVGWEILDQNTNLVICSGGYLDVAYPDGITTPIAEPCCLANGCYRLRVYDQGGDGFVSGGQTGGYQLRESGVNGARIIDNFGNFSSGSVSALASTYENGAFCVPVGTDKLIFSSCDRLDWVANKFIVASANPTVSAQFGVTNATSGYEFWFFDPNGTYSYRRFRSHATSDGFGTGATRACHFKVNGWINSVSTPHIPSNVLLNVRIRGRVAGNNLPFGPACLFKIDAALAACPRVKLQDDPANTSDFSCGVFRDFGGASNPNNRITAAPPQPIPAVASSAVRYQFRFRIPGENICIVRPPQNSARLVLNWTTGTPLQCSKTYEVDVRVSLDGGATWCFGPAASSEAAACADTQAWGKVCLVNINPCPSVNGGGNSMVVEGNNTFTMYPNPNRGDQLFLSVSNVEEGVNTVDVDIFDMAGKRVMARTIAVQDGFVNTNLELNGDLAGGLYVVNITAGSKAYTERLVIQP